MNNIQSYILLTYSAGIMNIHIIEPDQSQGELPHVGRKVSLDCVRLAPCPRK